MKQMLFIIFSLTGFVLYSQTPAILSLEIFPQNPSTNDEVFLATHVTTGNLGQYLGSTVAVNGNNITVESCYFEGALTQPQEYFDTISIGYLGSETYNLDYTAYISWSSSDCTPQQSNNQDTTFYVDSFVSVDDINSIKLRVYPNPSNGILNIEIPENIEIDEIQVLDISSRTLKTLNYSSSIQIDLPEGTYFIRLLNKGNLVGTEKVLMN